MGNRVLDFVQTSFVTLEVLSHVGVELVIGGGDDHVVLWLSDSELIDSYMDGMM